MAKCKGICPQLSTRQLIETFEDNVMISIIFLSSRPIHLWDESGVMLFDTGR